MTITGRLSCPIGVNCGFGVSFRSRPTCSGRSWRRNLGGAKADGVCGHQHSLPSIRHVLRSKGAAVSDVPRFQKTDTRPGLRKEPGRFCLVDYDAALGKGELDVCWELILSYINSLDDAPLVAYDLEEEPPVMDELEGRSSEQPEVDPPGLGASSLQEEEKAQVLGKSDGVELPDVVPKEVDPSCSSSGAESQVDLEYVSEVERSRVHNGGNAIWQMNVLKEQLRKRHKRFLTKCIMSSRHDVLLKYLRLFPAQERLLSWLVKEHLKANQCNLVVEILELHQERGIKPDKYSYSALITALVRMGDIKGAKSTFDTAIQRGNFSLYAYNIMIDGYGRYGDLKGALEVWDQLCRDGLTPDSYTYTGLIRVMGSANRMNDVKRLLKDMMDAELLLMPHTFTILFDAAAKCGEEDPGWLMSLCNIMYRNGIAMNNHILSSMISAVSQVKLDTCRIDYVFDLVQEFRANVGAPAPNVYTCLLLFCGRQGIYERAVDVWATMEEDGVKPNAHIYSAALTTCSLTSSRDPVICSFVEHVGARLRQEWRVNQNSGSGSMLIAFNSLINACTSLRNTDQATKVYVSMQREGPAPDAITYNTLLNGFASKGQLEPALTVMEDMRRANVQMTGCTYVALLTASAKAHQADLAWSLFEEMVESGIQTPVEAYTALMDACVKEGSREKIRQAFELLDTMQQSGLQPTAVTYGCLLAACWRTWDVDRAFDLYREADRNQILPTDGCHQILINMATSVGRLDEAVELIMDLSHGHASAEHNILNSLARVLVSCNCDRAMAVLRLMQDKEMEPTRETYHSVILSCVKDLQYGRALDLYRKMRMKGIKGSREVGSSIIQCLCSMNDATTAAEVAFDMMRCASVSVNENGIAADIGTRDLSQLPDIAAFGELCCGLVRNQRLGDAMKMFRITQSLGGDTGMGWLASNMESVYESLIELNCRQDCVDEALEVYDTWKEEAAMVIAHNRSERGEEWAYKRHPRISQASLAFLLATCQSDPSLEWRVHDVCASMRQQGEWAHEAKLPRPRHTNHHFSE